MSHPDSVVVVGAGLAGCRVVETLRDEGFAGSVTLLNAEPHLPYDRPPLSKQVLLHENAGAPALLDAGRVAELALDLRNDCIVRSIDKLGKRVHFAGGGELAYDRLVIATGSSVRVLPMLPPGPSVHYLRTLDDAIRLRAALKPGLRLAIVGAGVIGLEVAASASQLGLSVVVIEQGERVMARGASASLSRFVHEWHGRNGVEILLGTTLAAADLSETGARLKLGDDRSVAVDHVLVGVGASPNADLAIAAGLDVLPQGIVVDGFGRTDDPNIFAAGEVAYAPNGRTGTRERQESWTHASAHGEAVARAILGGQDAYSLMPYYWTDQADLGVQVIGASDGAQEALRGDPASGRFVLFHLEGPYVAGATVVGGSPATRAIRKLVEKRAVIAAQNLVDLGFDLNAAAAAL